MSRAVLRGRRRRLSAVLACACVALVAACSPQPGVDEPDVRLPAPEPALEALYNQRPDWQRCGNSAQCATIQVPVDWSEPGGPTWPIALTRRKATEDSRRVLVVNYGGPGVAGAQLLKTAGAPTRAIAENVDLVAFDPRGTGGSRPVGCLDDAQLDEFLGADAPAGSEVDAAIAMSAEFAEACVASEGDRVTQLGTDNVVRDLDVIRSVLDQETLDYLGFSYGTLVGALYADRFGDNVGRMVLDGAVDPALSFGDFATAQAASLEHALTEYVTACLAGTAGDCPLTGDVPTALSQVRGLLDQAAADGISTTGDRRLTAALAAAGLISALYDDSSWLELTPALADGLAGDGTALLALADDYNRRDADGHYTSNLSQAYWAVTCSDSPVQGGIEAVEATAARIRDASPTLGGQLDYSQLTCAEWPVTQGRAVASVRAPDAPPLLVIGTTNDPATPFEWAESLAGQLAHGRLLIHEGEGHTVYGKGDTCVDRTVDRYLTTGALPVDGTTCS